MAWIQRLFSGKGAGPPHISANNSAEERGRRLKMLSAEERKAYQWLFEGYSEPWTMETLGLEKKDAKKLYICIYRKLGVGSSQELVHYYAPREVRLIEEPDEDTEGDEE